MHSETVLVFTQAGMGSGPTELSQVLATRFLTLLLESGQLPGKICFYTEGVRLACQGSPVLALLGQLEQQGVELVLCKTCLDYFGLTQQVQVGVVGGMPDILTALQAAQKVIHL